MDVATYDIRQRSPFGYQLRHKAHVSIGSLEARLDLDGTSTVTRNVAAVSEFVEPVWHLRSEVEESCRDGALQVVEARQGERWKAVLRYCRAAINLTHLADVFKSG